MEMDLSSIFRNLKTPNLLWRYYSSLEEGQSDLPNEPEWILAGRYQLVHNLSDTESIEDCSEVLKDEPGDDKNCPKRIRIFAVREKEDALVLGLWRKIIMSTLHKILQTEIGDNYSASLVREGTSRESATPVIRIASPSVPSKIRRLSILQKLDVLGRITLANYRIEVQFVQGSFTFLTE
jgi:hypothetical protein